MIAPAPAVVARVLQMPSPVNWMSIVESRAIANRTSTDHVARIRVRYFRISGMIGRYFQVPASVFGKTD